MTCMICLNTSHTYYNLCSVCNNFIVCSACYYNDTNLHTLGNCAHCRHKLTKTFNYSCETLNIITYYYKYLIIHVLVNIIYSNIFLYLNFPRDVYIDSMFSNTITHLLLVNNLSNCIVIPIIYSNFENYYHMSIVYAFVNILYSIIFFASSNHKDVNLYYTYYVIYFYLLTLVKFVVFTIYQLLIAFNRSKKLLMYSYNLQIIKVRNVINNSISSTQV